MAKPDTSLIRVLLVDDHQLFMDGMRYVLKKLAIDVDIHTISNPAEIDKKSIEQWHLILMDVSMPGSSGFLLLKELRSISTAPPIVMMSSSEERHDIELARSLGAQGYLCKSYSEAQLLEKIQRVLNGHEEFFVPPSPAESIDDYKKTRMAKLKALGITRKQFEVLQLLGEGYTNQQISETQSISLHTVKSHVADLLRRLSADNRTRCVAEARRLQLL